MNNKSMNNKSDYIKEAENFVLMTMLSIVVIIITSNLMVRGINGDRMAYRWLILLRILFAYGLTITNIWESIKVKVLKTPTSIALLSLAIIPSRYLVQLWGSVSAISVITLTAIVWIKYSGEYFEYLYSKRLDTLRTLIKEEED